MASAGLKVRDEFVSPFLVVHVLADILCSVGVGVCDRWQNGY